ncbi:sensor histidine kinase [Pseudomonas subflava]|uniref:sensor histidine kinase n=1 Tax=Pseudomonas subflava TaxID=2952933 RepID=UPI002079CCEE|nr:histidine kinase [Pseudomonas subflava]
MAAAVLAIPLGALAALGAGTLLPELVNGGVAPGLLGLFAPVLLLVGLVVREAARGEADDRRCGTAGEGHAALARAKAENLLLRRALLQVEERERNRLGRALHDDLGQYVAGIRARAGLFALLADDPPAVRRSAQQLEQHCRALQDGFHGLVRDLYPATLERQPLERAVRELAGRWQTEEGLHCRVGFDTRLPEPGRECKLQLYRLLQEALTNVARHSGAQGARLRLRRRGQRLCLALRDDGHGQPPARRGVGLLSMSERARELGGELLYRGRPGRGWSLYLSIPLEEVGR